MKDQAHPVVVEAEIYLGGVMITFDNGLCAIFPSDLLYASKDLATIMSGVQCDPESNDEGAN